MQAAHNQLVTSVSAISVLPLSTLLHLCRLLRRLMSSHLLLHHRLLLRLLRSQNVVFLLAHVTRHALRLRPAHHSAAIHILVIRIRTLHLHLRMHRAVRHRVIRSADALQVVRPRPESRHRCRRQR